jgi:Protein of unknown function (DUF3151)
VSEPNVQLSAEGPPRTVLAAEDPALLAALESATDRDAVARVVAAHPRSLFAWAALGDAGRDDVERYAAYRIGYHRGLDTLRASGWRGSGYVRWIDETNRGFLRCLRGLGEMAAAIGEDDEVDRIGLFLRQLDG